MKKCPNCKNTAVPFDKDSEALCASCDTVETTKENKKSKKSED